MIHIGISVEEVGGHRWTWSSCFSSELVDVIRATKNPTILKELFALMSDSATGAVMNPSVIPPGAQAPLKIT